MNKNKLSNELIIIQNDTHPLRRAGLTELSSRDSWTTNANRP